MKSIVLILGLLTVAGCTKTVEEMSYSERKALSNQIVKRCIAQGVQVGSKEMNACTYAEAQREVYGRRRQAAVEDAQRSSGPTVCNRVGSTVICN